MAVINHLQKKSDSSFLVFVREKTGNAGLNFFCFCFKFALLSQFGEDSTTIKQLHIIN